MMIVAAADGGYLPGNHRAVSVRLEAVDDDLFNMHLQQRLSTIMVMMMLVFFLQYSTLLLVVLLLIAFDCIAPSFVNPATYVGIGMI